MAAASQAAHGTVLNSWKEIANYLNRGVRTVQRWEHDLGLPVRRPRAKSRSAVIALPAELDEWLRIAPKNEAHRPPPQAMPALVVAVRNSVHEMAELRRLCHDLRAANREAVHTLLDSIHHMQKLQQCSEQLHEDLKLNPQFGAGWFTPNLAKPNKPN